MTAVTVITVSTDLVGDDHIVLIRSAMDRETEE